MPARQRGQRQAAVTAGVVRRGVSTDRSGRHRCARGPAGIDPPTRRV